MEFINLHQHTHFSNAISIPECVNKPSEYIEYAVNNNLPAVCFTEHGNILSWVSKKMKANDAGLKYIHGVEAYITDTFNEKIRDNFHLVLLAKNHDGVKELNKLISKGFVGRGNKEVDDPHYYYAPRISFDEVSQTSDNILILTACLASPLWQHYSSNNLSEFDKWKQFFVDNKHRVWLEVQPHNHGEQIAYNKLLKEMAEKYDMRLVATNDVHALDQESDKVRKILMRSKNIRFEDDNEYDFECWLKSYGEMLNSFLKQGVFSEDEIHKMLQETNRIVDLVEDFAFDKSFKYPQIFENPEQRLKDLIKQGYIKRGINKLDSDTQKIYKERIKKEYSVYKQMGSIDFMLLMQYVIGAAADNGRYFGYARGSASGSIIAYLIGVTEIDSIKEDLSFERFMNPDRISLADIDSDISGVGEDSDRDWVVDFLMNNDKFNCSAIVTYNTLGIKGAIKDVGRAMGYSAQEMNDLTKNIEDDIIPSGYEIQYKELIDIAKKVVGVITSIGRHAGGFIVTTKNIEEELGTVEVSNSTSVLSAVAMKEVDGLNFVKLDILGLDNIALINMTCEMAGLPRATPQSEYIDFNDKNVMEELRLSTVGIFQFGGKRAEKLVKDMFRQEVQQKMVDNGVNASPIDQLALLNGAMRPGGASIIDDIVNGKIHDNGHEVLNKMLEPTLGYLIYQESQIEFLVKFCGRSNAQADIVRRAIGKKDPETLNKELPKIETEFIETMVSKYGVDESRAKEIIVDFIQVFQDASNYSFSRNHAIPYSYIGYISAWLRYYYPLEFLTSAFIIFKDKQNEMNQLTQYAASRGIKILPAKYGYAKGDYFFDKETNTIYEGTGVIKGNNVHTGDALYTFASDNTQLESFVDFLVKTKDDCYVFIEDRKPISIFDIFKMSEEEVKAFDKEIRAMRKEDESNVQILSKALAIDKTKILSLIRLEYFDCFRKNKKLEQIYNEFAALYKASNKTFHSKWKNYWKVKKLEDSLDNEAHSIFDQCTFELGYLGRCRVKNSNVNKRFMFVTKVENVGATRTSLTFHSINKGKELPVKIGAKTYRNVPLKEGDLVEVNDYSIKPKKTKIDGVWQDHPTDKEVWIKEYRMVRKGVINK